MPFAQIVKPCKVVVCGTKKAPQRADYVLHGAHEMRKAAAMPLNGEFLYAEYAFREMFLHFAQIWR